MAQLNPNFEIDFSDINSYEQIQLINDAQLAKENLLMHRAYREPSDDEVIRNNYSSYTFIDFRPRIFAAKGIHNHAKQSTSSTSNARGILTTANSNNDINSDQLAGEAACIANNDMDLNHRAGKPSFELEKFSDIFERINIWLKLNKEWQAVSVETLVYDSTSQFNHMKSSTYSNHLPRNTRGLRLHLCPFKSRFSGPQKIGCINVVPRRLDKTTSSSTDSIDENDPSADDASNYENLDQILARLNELLLSKPIEGRILSVETITMPIINGRVDYESNYITDGRLNLLEQHTNCSLDPQPPVGSKGDPCLLDILRVYYEFGPMVCGLVNLIDYVPRFYSPTEVNFDYDDMMAQNEDDESDHDEPDDANPTENNESASINDSANGLIDGERKTSSSAPRKSFATESLTRLIRRSLAWFEDESRRFLESSPAPNALLESSSANGFDDEDRDHFGSYSIDSNNLKLRLCNIQVRHKTFLKGELYKITPTNILDIFQTKGMVHRSKASLISSYSQLNPTSALNFELAQPYDVKFVRLAYVLPIYDRLSHIVFPPSSSISNGTSTNDDNSGKIGSNRPPVDEFSPQSVETNCQDSDKQNLISTGYANNSYANSHTNNSPDQNGAEEANLPGLGTIKGWALNIMMETNERHLRGELAHQAGLGEADKLNESPIGQLTYRLFAPCQLVNSSSCFAINPVNSSSPLARRGSVDLNGSGLSSDSAHPSALYPATGGTSPGSCNHQDSQQQYQDAGSNHSVAATEHQTTLGNKSSIKSSMPTLPISISSKKDNSSGLSVPRMDLSSSLKSFSALFPSVLTGDTGGSSSVANDSKNNLTNSSTPDSVAGLVRFQASNHGGQQPQFQNGGQHSRFTANEFESVEAIRKRMEIYVTTNSMKVLAGETLIVNLSSNLSCLSNAIEQTVVKASFARTRPSTWVSVYILYVAVDEPLMPSQLLAQQKIRELTLISEAEEMTSSSSQEAPATTPSLPAESPIAVALKPDSLPE